MKVIHDIKLLYYIEEYHSTDITKSGFRSHDTISVFVLFTVAALFFFVPNTMNDTFLKCCVKIQIVFTTFTNASQDPCILRKCGLLRRNAYFRPEADLTFASQKQCFELDGTSIAPVQNA